MEEHDVFGTALSRRAEQLWRRSESTAAIATDDGSDRPQSSRRCDYEEVCGLVNVSCLVVLKVSPTNIPPDTVTALSADVCGQ